MDQNAGRYIIFIGIAVVVIGILIYFLHDKLHWIGRLPGDIRIEKQNFRFYFPIVTMLLISLVLTIIINLIKKFL
jgi:magnesium-transporting ATPase (P-type)